MSETIKLTLIPIAKKQPEYGVEVLLHNENEGWYKKGVRSSTDHNGDHCSEFISDAVNVGTSKLTPTHFAYLN